MADRSEQEALGRIDELVAEEHRLREQAAGKGLDETGRVRLIQIQGVLDQCWDLLRQRRARAEFHQDPAAASARPVGEVESYQQ